MRFNTERELSAYMVFQLRELADAHVTRIENAISAGIPDIVATLPGKTFWIELKNGAPLLRPHQYVWIRHEVAAGGRVYVVASIEEKPYVWNMGKDELDAAMFVQRTNKWVLNDSQAKIGPICRETVKQLIIN